MRRVNPADIIAKAHAAVPDEDRPAPERGRKAPKEKAPRKVSRKAAGKSARKTGGATKSCHPAERREPSFTRDRAPAPQAELPLPEAPRRRERPRLGFGDRRRAKPRGERGRRRFRPVRALLVATLVTSPVWLWNAGHLDRARAWTAAFGQRAAINARLTVNDVLIEGRRRTPKPQLARALKIRHGGSILAVDLDAARARIEALPWVAEAAVERRLPGTIYVEITERKPIARWRIGRRIKLIDADGVAISGFRAADYARLPLVSGPGAPAAAGPLLDFLKTAPKLAARVREARRLGKRRWDLIFRGGVVLMLPERAPDKAWRKFARLEAEHRLLARGLLAIDLRLPDRVVLRAPGPLPPPLRRTGRERAT